MINLATASSQNANESALSASFDAVSLVVGEVLKDPSSFLPLVAQALGKLNAAAALAVSGSELAAKVSLLSTAKDDLSSARDKLLTLEAALDALDQTNLAAPLGAILESGVREIRIDADLPFVTQESQPEGPIIQQLNKMSVLEVSGLESEVSVETETIDQGLF